MGLSLDPYPYGIHHPNSSAWQLHASLSHRLIDKTDSLEKI